MKPVSEVLEVGSSLMATGLSPFSAFADLIASAYDGGGPTILGIEIPSPPS